MAETAVVSPPADPTPPPAPAGDGGAPPAAPPAPPAAAAGGDDIPPGAEDGIPWQKYNGLRRDYREAQRRFEALQKEYGTAGEKITTLEKQWAEAGPKIEQFEALMSVLDRNPEYRDQLLAMLDGNGVPPPRRAAVVPPAKAPPSGVNPELETRLAKALEYIEHQQKRGELERQRAADHAIRTEVETMARKFLTEKNYDPDVSVEDIMDYLARAAQRGELDDDLVDAPLLMNRWHARQERITQHRLKSYATNKVQDAATTAPALPGGGAPVSGTDKPAALGTSAFTESAKEAFRRLLTSAA